MITKYRPFLDFQGIGINVQVIYYVTLILLIRVHYVMSNSTYLICYTLYSKKRIDNKYLTDGVKDDYAMIQEKFDE